MLIVSLVYLRTDNPTVVFKAIYEKFNLLFTYSRLGPLHESSMISNVGNKSRIKYKIFSDKRSPMNYRHIWFDLGLTLVQSPIATLYQRVLTDFGECKEAEELKKAFYLTDKEFMRLYPHVLGTEPAQYLPWYLGAVNYHLGIRLDLADICLAFIDAQVRSGSQWRLVPGAAELLAKLKHRGVHLGLISNWDCTCRKVLADNNIDSYFDVTVVSSEVGIEKPDAAIFQAALDAADVDADQVLYIGDNYYDDVVGAAKAGIKSLLIAPYGRLGIEEIDYSHIICGLEEVRNYIG